MTCEPTNLNVLFTLAVALGVLLLPRPWSLLVAAVGVLVFGVELALWIATRKR